MRAFANFIMAGRLQAMLVAATSSVLSLLLPPFTAVLAYVGAGALMLVTLRLGASEGARVMAGALLATALFGFLAMGQAVPVVIATLILWFPAWVLATVLRGSQSLAWTLQLATGMALLGVLLAYLLLGDPAAHWRQLLEPLGEMALGQAEVELSREQVQALLDQASTMMTGAVAAALLLGLLLSLVLARSWQAMLYNPGGFRSEFHALAMPGWMGAAALGCMLGARFMAGGAGAFLLQAGLVALVPFLFVGLAVVHATAARFGLKPAWLAVMYALLLFLPEAVVMVAVLGVLDGWFRFRRSASGTGAA
jgi:hypothetical protein